MIKKIGIVTLLISIITLGGCINPGDVYIQDGTLPHGDTESSDRAIAIIEEEVKEIPGFIDTGMSLMVTATITIDGEDEDSWLVNVGWKDGDQFYSDKLYAVNLDTRKIHYYVDETDAWLVY